MPSLVELTEQLQEKRQQLHQIWAEAGNEYDMSKVTCISGDTDYKIGEINRREEELKHLQNDYDRLKLTQVIAEKNEAEYKRLNDPAQRAQFPGSGGAGSNGATSFGGESKGWHSGKLREIIAEHKGLRAFRTGQAETAVIELPVDLKTLVTLTTINRQNQRDDLVNLALETRTIGDFMLQGNTNANTIEYYEETTFTNAAAPVPEGGTKPESVEAYTLRTETVRKIAHNIPATKESLDDNDFLESELRGRLVFGVQRAEENQLLNGSGVAPQILGLLNRSGIQTQAKGTDPTPDAFYKAMQKIRGSAGAGFAEPTGIAMHPDDWTDIKLLRTADGIYIWGAPSDEGPDRLWGLPVRQTTAFTANTGLVGAFRPWATLVRREGITVTMSTEHSTFFVENKIMIQAEERLALKVTRPSAFATVTGI